MTPVLGRIQPWFVQLHCMSPIRSAGLVSAMHPVTAATDLASRALLWVECIIANRPVDVPEAPGNAPVQIFPGSDPRTLAQGVSHPYRYEQSVHSSVLTFALADFRCFRHPQPSFFVYYAACAAHLVYRTYVESGNSLQILDILFCRPLSVVVSSLSQSPGVVLRHCLYILSWRPHNIATPPYLPCILQFTHVISRLHHPSILGIFLSTGIGHPLWKPVLVALSSFEWPSYSDNSVKDVT
jgi:hypothetical protein